MCTYAYVINTHARCCWDAARIINSREVYECHFRLTHHHRRAMDKRQKYSIKEKVAMDKRQKYSIKEKVSSSSAPSGKLNHNEPQCSYMYGGLADLRRQTYLLKSPLKDNNTAAPRQNRREAPQLYCNAATAAAKLHAAAAGPSSTGCDAVKINPLLNRSDGGGSEALFHGQTSKIRRTKEREMMSAIMEVASHGETLSILLIMTRAFHCCS